MCFDKEKRREEEREELCLHHVIVHDFKASIMSYIAAVRKNGCFILIQ